MKAHMKATVEYLDTRPLTRQWWEPRRASYIGIGSTPARAFARALEIAAESGWDISGIANTQDDTPGGLWIVEVGLLEDTWQRSGT